ncbi:MAG: hypothetical protein ACPGJV_13305 [Bacteriovoracaceae bacterium]
MRHLTLLIALLTSVSIFAEEGMIVETKEISGKMAIKTIPLTEADWLTLDFGEGDNGKRCQSYILPSDDGQYLEVVITNRRQHPIDRFYITIDSEVIWERTQNDGLDGEDVGFHTYDKFTIGDHSIEFQKAGDSYYDVTITHNGETTSCTADF